jgi:hypothetical protein
LGRWLFHNASILSPEFDISAAPAIAPQSLTAQDGLQCRLSQTLELHVGKTNDGRGDVQLMPSLEIQAPVSKLMV